MSLKIKTPGTGTSAPKRGGRPRKASTAGAEQPELKMKRTRGSKLSRPSASAVPVRPAAQPSLLDAEAQQVLDSEPVPCEAPGALDCPPVIGFGFSSAEAARIASEDRDWPGLKDPETRYVVKANEVVTAAYSPLPRNQQRIINAAIALVDSTQLISDQKLYRLTPKDLIAAGVPKTQVSLAMNQARSVLFDAFILLQVDSETEKRIRWVQEVEYSKTKKELGIRFSFGIIPFISGLQNGFTKTNVADLGSFSLPVAARIYEQFVKLHPQTVWTISVERFRFMLGLSESYQQVKELRRRVIEPAVKEINAMKDLEYTFYVTYELINTTGGRKLDTIRFMFRRITDKVLDVPADPDEGKHLSENQAWKFVPLLMARDDFRAVFGKGCLDKWETKTPEFVKAVQDPLQFKTYKPWLEKVGFDPKFAEVVKKTAVKRRTRRRKSEDYPELTPGLFPVEEP